MPRDGANIYHRPPGTDAITNTTVASAPYNAYVADVEQDLNLPRPIVAGGTGANNAHDAMVALSGEIAVQGPVTNFDSFPFANGSFYSNAGATSAPEAAGAYVGTYYAHANPNYAYIEARNIFSPALVTYARWKNGGVWQPWQQRAGSVADLDAAYVNVAGDTMTGPLTVGGAGFVGSGGWPFVVHMATNVNFAMLNNAGEAYVGSFVDAAGAAPLALVGSVIRMPGPLKCEANITTGSSSTTGTYYFGNSGTKYLQYDGTNFSLTGPLLLGGGLYVGYLGGGSILGFGPGGSKYLQYDGTNFIFAGGPLYVNGALDIAGDITAHYNANAGTYKFGQAGNKYLTYDGTVFQFAGGSVTASAFNATTSASVGSGGLLVGGPLNAGPNMFQVFAAGGGRLYGTASSPLPGSNCALAVGFAGGGSQYGICLRPLTDSTPYMLFTNSAEVAIGQISGNGSNISYITTSDAALKDVKGAYTPADAVAIIRADPVMSWNWKATGESGVGWIAQKSYAVDPNLAVPPPEGEMPKDGDIEPTQARWGIDYGRRTPYLWAAVSQLLDRIDVLEAKIAQLEAAG